MFHCTKCQHRATSHKSLRDHVRRRCKEYSDFVCPRCGSGYNNKIRYKTHEKRCLVSAPTENGPRPTGLLQYEPRVNSKTMTMLLQAADHKSPQISKELGSGIHGASSFTSSSELHMMSGSSAVLPATKTQASTNVLQKPVDDPSEASMRNVMTLQSRKRARSESHAADHSLQRESRSLSQYSCLSSAERDSAQEPDTEWKPVAQKERKRGVQSDFEMQRTNADRHVRTPKSRLTSKKSKNRTGSSPRGPDTTSVRGNGQLPKREI